MAKTKSIPQEREYIINLRREILKVPRYKRTPKAIKGVKIFIAKHMRIPDRDLNKVKLDKYLNEELWFRGIQNPPTRIKVKVKRDGENVLVSLAELPTKLKFKKEREEKAKVKSDKIKKEKKVEAVEEKKEEKSESDVKEEKEKEVAVAEAREKQAEMQAKEQKHMGKIKPAKTERIQRKALQK